MTVKELIEKLKTFDSNLTVLVDTEGAPLRIKLIEETESYFMDEDKKEVTRNTVVIESI